MIFYGWMLYMYVVFLPLMVIILLSFIRKGFGIVVDFTAIDRISLKILYLQFILQSNIHYGSFQLKL